MIRGAVNYRLEAVVAVRMRGSGGAELDFNAVVDSGFPLNGVGKATSLSESSPELWTTVTGRMIAKKTCRACRKKLSLADFNGSSKTADGLARDCRACTNARRRGRSAAKRPPERVLRTVLGAALRQGDGQSIRKLLRAGIAPRCDWICETMREGHLALAEMLLEAGVKRNAFTMAAMADAQRLARRLRRLPDDARLAAGMEPAGERVTPLHVACASDWKRLGHGRQAAQTRVAMMLAEHGAQVNALARYRGIDDATPLLSACWSSENVMLVRWLLEQGAEATDECLLAALGHLQRHGRTAYDIAEALLAWGLAVDGGVCGARTPLQAFAHQADHRTVAWLIAHGADLDARGPGGRTAAHYAAERNTGPRTLALLVEQGADLSARDDDGHTPWEIAKRNKKARLVAWIARHGRRSGKRGDSARRNHLPPNAAG